MNPRPAATTDMDSDLDSEVLNHNSNSSREEELVDSDWDSPKGSSIGQNKPKPVSNDSDLWEEQTIDADPRLDHGAPKHTLIPLSKP
jgi:hypothetical protein